MELAASDDELVAVAAANAASNITHPDVRELAFRLVENCAPARWAAISILDRNFEAGDHRIVVDWFKAERDRDVRHSLGIDLHAFWKHHVEPHTESEMLLTHYEHGPCSSCREFTVSRLIELQALPDGIREECAYDANDDVRQLVRPQ